VRTSPSAPRAGGRARGTCSAGCWIPRWRTVSPEYSFRLFVSMETGDARYNHTNTKMWVASGARMGAGGLRCVSSIRVRCVCT